MDSPYVSPDGRRITSQQWQKERAQHPRTIVHEHPLIVAVYVGIWEGDSPPRLWHVERAGPAGEMDIVSQHATECEAVTAARREAESVADHRRRMDADAQRERRHRAA